MMRDFLPSIKNFLLASIFSLFVISFCFGQGKVDLELKVQTAAESVRGGEKFSYIVTIKNVGSAKATDVVLRHTGREEVVSAISTAGTCGIAKDSAQIPTPFFCEVGDIKQDETIVVNFSLKISDFGGEEEMSLKSQINLPEIGFGNQENKSSKSLLADVQVDAEGGEENQGNNRAQVLVELLPSKNLPPRVKIISPIEEAIIIRSARKVTTVTFTIQASDPDGAIEKVKVHTQQFQISVEYPENKIVVEGKKYSIKEFEDNKPAFQKYLGGDAVKTGKDTYTFTLKNPQYGLNQVLVEAIDNGGRSSHQSVRFMVKQNN